MYSNIYVIKGIYELTNHGIKIWADENNIKLFVPEGIVFTEEQKFFININKNNILKYLKNNHIHSKEYDYFILNSGLNKLMLSFAQERLWFINKYEEGSNAYNIPIIFKLTNNTILEQLKLSLQNIVNRHEILRTVIKEDNDGNPYQLVLDNPLNFVEINVNTQLELERELKSNVNHIYDLSIEHPIKVVFYKLDDEYYLSIVIHHIAFDGWSIEIFFKELNSYLNYNLKNTSLNLTALSIQYKDFALWQRNYLKGNILEKQLSYWQHKLNGYETLNVITDYPRPMELDYTGANLYFELDETSSASLRNLAKELNVSLYTVLLSGYYLLLRCYSNQNDLIIGTPIANRHYSQIEDLIGFFVNTLALRITINSNTSIKEFIERVGQEVITAQLHQDLPFEKLVRELKIPKDTSIHPIFQVMFGIDNFTTPTTDLNKQLQFYSSTTNLYAVAKFDISTFIDDSEPCLKGSFNYAVSLYKETTIKSFIETYIEVLKQLPKAYKIHDLNYLTTSQQQLLNSWNQTERAYPYNKTMHQLFEEQVERTSDSIALVYENIKLSYQMLNAKANQLADYLLQTQDIKPDTLIALCLERSEHMLIAILAVLKAGAAYVPIDPNYPDERIKYIITDSCTKIILTNEIHIAKLKQITTTTFLAIDAAKTQQLLKFQSTKNPKTLITSNNLAYVIYTSGTTGNPKGVMIEHRGIINRIKWMNDKYPLKEQDKILQKTPYTFDVSVWELFWANWCGASLVFVKPDEHKNTSFIINIIYKEAITVTHFVPSMLNVFEDELALHKINFISSLNYIFSSGEPLNVNQAQFCHKLLPNTAIHNLYGPTETSVDVLYYDCSDKDIADIYIGKAINNITAYALSLTLCPTPIGAISELYIGGVGLARGYLNQPGLTAERFIANPFQTEEEIAQNKNSRIYKTGDLVRYLPDGNLEYIGRNDFQVKIRGFRIELGEIENALSSYNGIKQSVVLAKEGNNANKYLVGYYVADAKLNTDAIQEYLQSKLPEYMIPTVLIHLESLPLTVNGKLDRKALPEPTFNLSSTYIAPRNELEHKVCKIWAKLLGLPKEKISINDDFFKLGGDSIVSIQLVSRLRQQLNLQVSVKEIFQHKTILRLFDNVWHVKNNSLVISAEQGILSGKVPLLPIQKWFFINNFPVAQHWNQSFIVKVPQLNVELLKQNINKLIAYHDSLRLQYQSSISQYYNDTYKPESLKTLNITTLKSKEGTKSFNVKLQNILTNWQANFNLKTGPLYSIGYIYGYKDGSARLHFALHHLIVDAVSWRILTKDLQMLYNGHDLGAKGSSYREWTQAIKTYALVHKNEKKYWLKVLADYNSNILPKTNCRNYTDFSLTPEITKLLLTDSNKAYHTQINDLLLTALNYALAAITDNNINHIVLEGHGREEIDKTLDITNTTGWFTTIYPVRLELKAEIKDNIIAVKEALRSIPNKGIGFGAIIGYSNSLPKISFNYLGQFESSDSTFWSIYNEASGRSVHETNEPVNIIDINGLIIDNKLMFNIVARLNQDITTKLANTFKTKLEEIINHTVSQQRSYLTVSDIDYLITQECLDKLQSSKEINNIYLANSLQQGFIYHSLNQGDVDDAYRVQLIWEYHTQLNLDSLKTAWCLAQQRFSSLRLRFNWIEELIQIIDNEGNLDWRYVDLSQEPNSESQYKINQIQEQDRLEPYNLEQGNLFRVYLIKQQGELYTCIFSNHHAILDGWSGSILMQYIHECYLQLLNNIPITLSLDHSYEEAQQYLQAHRHDNQTYWEQYVSQLEERSDLSSLLSTPTRLSEYKHIKDQQEETIFINDHVYHSLKQICQTEGVTLNAILQYVWHKSLSVYSNSSQTVVGTIISGRNIPINNIEYSVGLYINTLPLIVNHKNQSIITAIKDILSSIQELNTRSEISLSKLQKQGERLFDSLFVYENYPTSTSSENFLNISFIKSIEKLDYPLGVIAYEVSNQLIFKLRYAAEIFNKTVIQDLLLTINSLLDQIAVNHNQSTCNLNYLTTSQQQLLNSWNQTERAYPYNKTMHQLFEEQVERTPDSIALVYENIKLSYQTLNAKANQLAHYLKKIGVVPDTLLAIVCDRSLSMVIGVIGILKAGGTYVPLDTKWPLERKKHIILSLKIGYILTDYVQLKWVQSLQWMLETLKFVICLDTIKLKPKEEEADWSAIKTEWGCVAKNAYNHVRTSGFIRSYTGNQFLREEVDRYKNHVINMTLPYVNKNTRVLEIGCGAGFIMFSLARKVQYYLGVDPSKSTQQKNLRYIAKNSLKNIKLISCFAHEIDKIKEKPFDLIILVSTIQFYPTYQHVEKILEKVLNLLKPGGSMLVVDVMDIRCQDEFHNSLKQFNNDNIKNTEMNTKKFLDRELYFNEDYFQDLRFEYSQVKDITIIKRQEDFNNGLYYRYDVFIKKALLQERSLIEGLASRKKYLATLEHINKYPVNNVISDVTANNTAYVIHTSGSTGVPKGVVVQHRAVINLINWVNRTFNIGLKDKILFVTSLCFDLSVYDIFGMLAAGGSIRIASKEELNNPEKLLQVLYKESITFWDSAPSVVDQFMQIIPENSTLIKKNENVRLIFLSGDWIPVSLPNRLKLIFPWTQIISLGGATEATIWSNYYPILSADKNRISIPYGKPIQNVKYYILDKHLKQCPIGVAGTLYISGECLAKGYLNANQEDMQCFMENPFRDTNDQLLDRNKQLYKTGDLVRYFSDGNIEFLGRTDNQVKLRGYRIELGEIETTLSSYNGIKQSVVLAKEGNNANKYLVGYYVADAKLNTDAIQEYLQSKLPEYMIPTVLIHLESLPLTVNGKLDRKALPEPTFNLSSTYIAPRNELEHKVCKIWAKLLGLPKEKISINDDFFKLGGDSIVSIQLVSRLRQQLNLQVSVKEIFQHKTILRLFDNVWHVKNNSLVISAEQGILSGKVPLLPIQKWFFINNFPVAQHWNQSFIVKVPQLNVELLKQNINKLIAYHDSLRLQYQSSISQYYNDTYKPESLKTLNITTLKSKEGTKSFNVKLQNILTNWQANFNLKTGPLYSIGYIYGYKDGSARLHFALHHLIVDAVSWRILTKDLQMLYNGHDLGAKGSSYREWTQAIKTYALVHKNEKKYWLKVLADYNSNILPKTNCRNYTDFSLTPEITKLLLTDSNKAYHTQINDLLLTALNYALAAITDNNINHIVLEGHGREEIDKTLDITNTTGWFTTIYPVRLELKAEIKDNIIAVKEALRSIPNKGIGFGAIIGYSNSLPKISFNYLGQFESSDSTFWSIYNEASGRSVHETNEPVNIIDINGLIIDNKLMFNIVARLNQDITTKLANTFKTKLEEIINHTVSQQRSYLTVSDIDYLITQECLDKLQSSKEINNIYLANSLQQGFIYHSLNQGDVDDAYRVQLIWEYHTQLNLDSLKTAWCLAQQRFSSLRLRFNWIEELIQIIDNEGNLDWRYVDLSQEPNSESQYKINQIQEQDRLEPYNLEQGNLFRVYLIKQQGELYTCIFSNHHAILDGWSGSILMQYIHECYLQLLNNIPITLSLDHSYEEAQQYLQAHRHDNQTYWEQYVSQLEERSDLSSLLSTPTRLSEYKHIKDQQEETIFINDHVYHSLKQICQTEGVTLNAILQYVWHKSLSVYSNSSQTVVGTIISGRNIPINNIEYSVGLYINTLPLIVNHKNQSIITAIKDILSSIQELNTRSEISLSKLQKQGERLFDSLFVYENYPTSTSSENFLNISFIKSIEKLDYPLGVIAYEVSNQLIFKLRYAAEIFNKTVIQDLLLTINSLLDQIAVNHNQSTCNLNYLTTSQQQLLNSWNQTERAYPYNKTMHQLFEEQVERTSDSIALVYENIKLSYQMLNTKANQLAHYLLQTQDIKPDTLIALCLERSEHMLIAILAVLKAGAAYVPIDPNYPDERIKYIIIDSSTKILLTNEIHIAKLKQITTTTFLAVDAAKTQQLLKFQSTKNPKTLITSNNLAYVIYTSGTTGNPKGVMIEHRGIINRIKWMNDKYPLKEQNKILQKTPYTFDVSVWELFWANWCGASLVFVKPDEHKNTSFIINIIYKEAITVTHFVPSMLNVFEDELALHKINFISSLNYIFSSGEPLNVNQAQFCHKLLPNTAIHNLYGPTETSVDVLYYDCSDKDIADIYIGKAINNITAYALSLTLCPTPIGAISELYIGGVGLARGYLNQPGLTAERFIANPFQTEEEIAQNKNSRIYKTGDLVRYLPDGNLEYIGRNDFQVKIRGFRIELGEIENALSSYSGIKQSVVLAKEGNNANKYLVGYYVADAKLNTDAIQEYLQSKLPEYMIPTVLIHLESLPLTVNGKLDRKALPEPTFNLSSTYIAPRNELEHKVCKIWAEVLGLPEAQIGINDNFFGLGGNSILAIKLLNQINRVLGSNIRVSAIFKQSNIERLTNHIIKYNIEENIIIEPFNVVTLKEQFLSFAQERLWFINKYEEGTNAYNIPIILKLNNNTIIEQLKTSLQNIVNRHEILRTVIKEDSEGNAYQLILDSLLTFTEIIVNNQLELEEQLKLAVNHIYDLSIEYPIKVVFYKLDDEYYLSIVIHHIAFDGWSTEIFFKELNSYLNYHLNNTSLHLTTLSIQYKDFALWQRNYLKGNILEKQLSYWQHKLNGYETLNIITDYPRSMELDYTGANLYFELDETSSTSLRNLAKELNVSLYTVLLSGYYLLLRCYSNQNDLIIGTPIANRHYSQIEDLIGFFVNTLALRITINSNTSIKEFIERVGQEVITAQLHQDLPFEKLVRELKIPKDTSIHPIFQVMFGIDNFTTPTTDLNKQLQFYSSTTNLYAVAKFDISTFIDDSEPCLKGSFNYAVSLYKETTIKSFIETYIEILKQLPKAYKIHDLNYLTTSQQQLLNSWNQTERAYPYNKTMHQLFEEQVERTSDSIALVYENIKLSYQMLNTKANQLAHYLLQTQDIKPDTLIALCLERSEHMLIAILAVLKAGAAYVPIDPNYPDERIKYIITDSYTKIILTNEIHIAKLKQITTTTFLAIDAAKTQQLLKFQSTKNPKTLITSNNLAYVIYTSGTTGNPKGVMVEHKGIINLKYDLTSKYELSGNEVILQLSNYVFDASVEQFMFALLNGYTLLLISRELWTNKINFYNYLNSNKVTHIEATSTLLQQYDLNKISALKRLIFGGEPLNYNKISLNNVAKIINVYGLTEMSITSTVNIIEYNNLAIGFPIANIKCYVLSPDLFPLPIGAIGVLYVGGVGLARGYLNQPKLTAEHFIANQFQTKQEGVQNKNSRIYKTGDLVRYLPDGNLEYIGRNDFQVKIRGFRIELGEIENVLSLYDGIKQSVVLAKEGNNANKYLVGYYVANAKLNADVIQKYLKSKLPEYMIPTVLIHLESLPLTVNGKLDRKALPEPTFNLSSTYIAPRNELEYKVCKIWAEVLGLPKEKISINDDFFRLGGNSILAINLVSKLNNFYKSQLKVSDIFVHKNIESLIPLIMQTKNNYQPIIKLNNTINYSNFFMIHPGIGGCEAYISLAKALKENFTCYGVDSYNLYNDIKITSLNRLSEYYLSCIDKIMFKSHQKKYHLLGWSLGGNIALNIAAFLEKMGANDIKVYLLDSMIYDSYLLSITNHVDQKKLELEYQIKATLMGYNKLYVQKVMSNIDTEMNILKQNIPILNKTNILLFKCMLKDNTQFKIDEDNKIYNYLSSLKYNNVDTICKDISKIKLVNVYNANHGNILEQEELLAVEIFNFGMNGCNVSR